MNKGRLFLISTEFFPCLSFDVWAVSQIDSKPAIRGQVIKSKTITLRFPGLNKVNPLETVNVAKLLNCWSQKELLIKFRVRRQMNGASN